MTSITIQGLQESTKKSLRVQAEQAGVSLESYIRNILKKVSASPNAGIIDILSLAEKYFGSKHGVELELPKRSSKPIG